MEFAFGGNSGMTYDQLQRKRKIADAMLAQNMTTPRNVTEGLSAVARAIMSNKINKKADAREGELRTDFNSQIAGLLGGGGGTGGSGSAGSAMSPFVPQPVDPNSPNAIGNDAMAAIDKPSQDDPSFELIKGFEGFRETPYWDVNALRTGYGSDTVTNPDGSVGAVGKGTRVTREDADRDLQRRVSTEFQPMAANAIGADVFGGLDQNKQAALTSIAYNYGKIPGSVVDAVRSPDPSDDAAAIAALGSHNDGVNAGRRQREADVYAGQSTGSNITMSAQNGPSGSADIGQIISLMDNPLASPGQKAVLSAMLQRQMDAGKPVNPMDAIELEKAQLELAQLRNPQADPMDAVNLKQAELDYAQDSATPPANPEAPTTKSVKLSDGSEVMVQWNPQTMVWDAAPIPKGGTTGTGTGVGKITEAVAKDIGFLARAQPAADNIDEYGDALTGWAGRGNQAAGVLPFGLTKGMQSDDYQLGKQAAGELATTMLRKDSGAAIADSEYAAFDQNYIPQPGDGAPLLKQKKEARRRMVEGLKAGLTPEAAMAAAGAMGDAATVPPPSGDLDFTKMSSADLGQVDISKLTEAQMTAMMKRFDEVNK